MAFSPEPISSRSAAPIPPKSRMDFYWENGYDRRMKLLPLLALAFCFTIAGCANGKFKPANEPAAIKPVGAQAYPNQE